MVTKLYKNHIYLLFNIPKFYGVTDIQMLILTPSVSGKDVVLDDGVVFTKHVRVDYGRVCP
jgi:hypothetical protein